MTPKIRFTAEALREAGEAVSWYRERSAVSATRFAATIDSAVQEICERPEAWPILRRRPRFRRRVLSTFPYNIVYRIAPTEIIIVAVLHQRRSPKTLYARLRSP